tara:strand:+ start:2058 stop:5003 length:2946 start_codon:yes stop_codon:yes gene_type:complete
MTISTTIISKSYSGDGSTHSFAYNFPIFAEADLTVIIRSSAGTETVKTKDTHFIVTGAGVSSGGTVLFKYNTGTSSDAHYSSTDYRPASGETVVIRSELSNTQSMNLVANDPFPAETLETNMDKIVRMVQQHDEELGRSIKLSRTNTITSSEFTENAATRASKTLGFDSSGDLATVADYLPAGGDAALFKFATSTTDSDPGSGVIRLNHATIASATILYVDDLEYNGTDVSAWVQSWDDVSANPTNRGRIRLSKAGVLDTWHVFKINSALVDASGYTKVNLTYVDGSGTFAADDKIWISFAASGEDGVSAGYFYKFDSGTSDADPGAGEIAFNHGTYSSVTEIYIDDADQHGVSTQADTITWDDSTALDRGVLHIVDINDKTTYAKFKINGSATDASGYNKLAVSHIVSNNTFSAADELSVQFTRTGNNGAAPGYLYSFDNSTSDADPGAGELRLNNGTYASATAIYIDDSDANGVDISTDLLSWDDSTSTIRGFVHIVDRDDPTTYARFKLTGASTDASGYVKLACAHLSSNNTFSAADRLSVHFTMTGLKGDTGATGATGSTAGTSGLGMTWNSSTSDADPGAGKIAFNHGTLSSVSVLYVDDADDAGADISGFVQSWDDVSNSTARGYVQVTKEGTTSTYALFKVSGAVTDASGYTKVAVTHVVSNGSFSNEDGVGVQFVQSGADGSGSLDNVVEDTTPQLGGDLDVNGNDIVSTSNANIDIIPNGTGDVNLGADTVMVGDNNANATITTQGTGDLTLSTNSGTNSGVITIADGANGNISITPNGTGAIVLDGTTTVSAATSGWRHIKTQTGTNASSIDFLHGTSDVVFDDTYEIYEFIVHYAYGANNDEMQIHPSQDGSSFTTTNTVGFTAGGYRASGSNSAYHSDLGTNGFFRSAVNVGNAESEMSGGEIRVYSPFDSAKNTVALSKFSIYQASGTFASQITMGAMTAAGRTHGIRFKISSGNIYAKISLYGIKDS